MRHAISWFEIPATDLDRAARFYEEIMQIRMESMEMDGYKMYMFPLDDPMEGVGGAIVKTSEFHQPADTESKGVLIYLNANPDVQVVLDRIEKAGGKIVVPKTEISPEYGFMGVFIDSEGNRVGLHSVPASMLGQ